MYVTHLCTHIHNLNFTQLHQEQLWSLQSVIPPHTHTNTPTQTYTHVRLHTHAHTHVGPHVERLHHWDQWPYPFIQLWPNYVPQVIASTYFQALCSNAHLLLVTPTSWLDVTESKMELPQPAGTQLSLSFGCMTWTCQIFLPLSKAGWSCHSII